jgi:hypothetical protein
MDPNHELHNANHGLEAPIGGIPPQLTSFSHSSTTPADCPPILNDCSSPAAIPLTNSYPTPTTQAWRKRLLSIGFVSALLAGVAWATAPRARLSHSTRDDVARVDESVRHVAHQVDQAIDEVIAAEGLAKAEPADWHTIVRRMSLALIGNGASLEEIRVLEQIPEPERVVWWQEYLLKDRRSSDYLAERWTRATVGANQGPFIVFRRRKYVDWLADHFEQNTPYDVWVRQLLTSQGSWTDAPQVNFVTATLDNADDRRPDPIRLAGRTSRAFLALRIDCLQCHHDYLGNVSFPCDPNDQGEGAIEDTIPTQNDSTELNKELVPFRTGEQTDFHQLAAFFASMRLKNPFVGIRNTSLDYKYRYLNAEEETVVEPAVPYQRHLLPDSGNPRERLAIWVTHPENRAFARAAVNRTWALLFGKPMMEPVDSIPANGLFPQSMEILCDDFIAHKFDMRRLIRVILNTQAFQRDSQIDPERNVEINEQHEKYWAVFPLTQLRPEQVAASIHQASRIKAIDESSSVISQLELFGGVNEFTQAYGDRGEDEFIQQSVTIPQRLLVMNGAYVRERTKHDPVMNASTRIAELTRDDKAALVAAYLSVLNRNPTGAELDAFGEELQGKRGNARSRAMSSLYWTLFNCTEFQWNH